MPSETHPGPTINDTIHEVQGIFSSDAALQEAIGFLTRAGFDRAALSLPKASPAPAEATPESGAENPNTEDDTRQSRTLHTSMAASVGAMVGAGVTAATGGAAAVAAVAALALAAAAGGVMSAAHQVADAAQSQGRDAAAEAGQLVLAVTTPGADEVEKARLAMQSAGALRVEAVRRTHGALS